MQDDDLAVDFVTAASNLRALSYGIPTQALFAAKGVNGPHCAPFGFNECTVAAAVALTCRLNRDARVPMPRLQMAGNIIHAIATTNAILSGLIVAEALKLLAGELVGISALCELLAYQNRVLTPKVVLTLCSAVDLSMLSAEIIAFCAPAGCRPMCRATFLAEVPSGKRLVNPSTCDKPRGGGGGSCISLHFLLSSQPHSSFLLGLYPYGTSLKLCLCC